MKYKVELIERKIVWIDDLKIVLKVGKFFDDKKVKDCYIVQSNYKNIYTVSDTVDIAINECINRIKNKEILSNNNVKLISEKEGVNIAKEFFWEHYKEISNVEKKQNLWFSWQVDDNILKLEVLYSQSSHKFDKAKLEYPQIVATILVDLISGECDIYDE